MLFDVKKILEHFHFQFQIGGPFTLGNLANKKK